MTLLSATTEELMASRRDNGFSLLELMITISISLILGGITYMGLQPILLQSHVNSAYDKTMMVLRNTRNLAITQGHEYYVNFNPNGFPVGTIQVQYQPGPVGGIAQPIQQVITYTIPPDVSFAVWPTFPAATPDNFGTGVNAIDFGQTLAGAPFKYVVFMPDGSSQDGFNNLNSGVIYITRPSGNMYTSKAVTVWGATGRIRGWSLVQQGGPVWVQQ
jgi:prepilin-type N-terminal cleavage/methylation domain-containing protein